MGSAPAAPQILGVTAATLSANGAAMSSRLRGCFGRKWLMLFSFLRWSTKYPRRKSGDRLWYSLPREVSLPVGHSDPRGSRRERDVQSAQSAFHSFPAPGADLPQHPGASRFI